MGTRSSSSRVEPHKALLGTMPDAEVAKLAGVSGEAVRIYRTKLGIPAAGRASSKPKAKGAKGAKGTKGQKSTPQPAPPKAQPAKPSAAADRQWELRVVVTGPTLGAAVAAVKVTGGEILSCIPLGGAAA